MFIPVVGPVIIPEQRCPNCNQKVRHRPARCPKCGWELRTSSQQELIVLIVGILLAVLGVLVFLFLRIG